jgi:hypothetical protein
MGWAKGQINGGRPYADLISQNILPGVALPLLITPGSSVGIKVPWGVDGFKTGRVDLLGSTAGATTMRVLYAPFDSDGNAWLGFGVSAQLVPDTLLAGLAAAMLSFSFNDTPVPGNHLWRSGGVFTGASNMLNPVGFEGAALMHFHLVNAGPSNFTLDNVRASLQG